MRPKRALNALRKASSDAATTVSARPCRRAICRKASRFVADQLGDPGASQRARRSSAHATPSPWRTPSRRPASSARRRACRFGTRESSSWWNEYAIFRFGYGNCFASVMSVADGRVILPSVGADWVVAILSDNTASRRRTWDIGLGLDWRRCWPPCRRPPPNASGRARRTAVRFLFR